MKLKVQTQHLQAGDIVGSGETIIDIVRASIHFPTSKVMVTVQKGDKKRTVIWGKYTMINIDRADFPVPSRASHCS